MTCPESARNAGLVAEKHGLAGHYRASAISTAFWMAKASDSVIGDLPLSFRLIVRGDRPIIRVLSAGV